MKKLLLFFVLLSTTTLAQLKKDTIVTNKSFTSIYCLEMKCPLLVYTKEYRSGGDCSRANYHFTGIENKTAQNRDYSHSNRDKGHMIWAELKAYNCYLDSLTFTYVNCFPQTPELNRGIWKSEESEIVKLSQNDSIFIMVGGIYGFRTIGNGVYVPDSTYHVVYNIKTKKIVLCSVFTNTSTPVRNDIDFKVLSDIIRRKYNIDLKRIIKKNCK